MRARLFVTASVWRAGAALTIIMLVTVTVPAAARADLPAVGTRAIGRAGAGVVSSDDGAALWHNPAGLARRGGWRAQVGVALGDPSSTFRSDAFAGTAATVEDHAGAAVVPALAIQGNLGERVVVGAAWIEPTDLSWESAVAPDTVTPDGACGDTDDDRARYPNRYAGTRRRDSRRGVGVGGAVRVREWLALGATALAFDVALAEDRAVWGGLGAPQQVDFLCPAYDMRLAVDGRDRFVPGGVFGVLYAPVDAPIELAISLLWIDAAELAGRPTLSASRGLAAPGGPPNVTAQVSAEASARARVDSLLIARAGARFVASRYAVELEGELSRGGDAGDWTVGGVSLTATSPGTTASLDSVVVPDAKGTFALRAAADFDVVPGFLTLTAGYAFRGAGLTRTALAPSRSDLDAHTFAAGVEVRVERATVTIGVSRTEGVAADVATALSGAAVIHPLSTGIVPAAGGSYDAAFTLVGLGLELEL